MPHEDEDPVRSYSPIDAMRQLAAEQAAAGRDVGSTEYGLTKPYHSWTGWPARNHPHPPPKTATLDQVPPMTHGDIRA